MKHQYFGDVNDYVKYGLLLCCAEAGFRVGILWMLTPEDGQPDGRKTKYLSLPEKWNHHDPDLFALIFDAVLRANNRHLRHIENNGTIIPHGQFWSAVVPGSKAERSRWYTMAISALCDSDLFFFDPDNGIEVPSTPPGRKDSSKNVYCEELQHAWKKKKSLIVFQHFPRVKRNEYISARVTEMQQRMKDAYVVPLKSSNVLYLLVHRAVGRLRVSKAIRLIEKRWSGRVSLYKSPKQMPSREIIRKEGFDFGFDPDACKSCPGNCCRGESGNIWVNHEDILSMCRFLQTNPIDFISLYLNRVNNRLSIKERVGEYGLECFFFDSPQRCCSIYPARPRQCRAFPFWEHFKRHKDELVKECPGVKL